MKTAPMGQIPARQFVSQRESWCGWMHMGGSVVASPSRGNQILRSAIPSWRAPNNDRRMPDYRRAYVPGGSFFFTLVTTLVKFPSVGDR
jgi:hypothetical protein